MPHHCIVPMCTNNSNMSELSFYRLPLHDQNLLQRWIVNIRRENIRINEYSRVCSDHFEGGKKKGKDAVPTIFEWTKEIISRAPPKQRDSIAPPRTFHSIGITTFIPSENHVSTCTKELVTNTSEDKEVLVKPAIVSAGYNTEIRTFCDASTNTIIIEPQVADASTQTELTVSYSDASMMTDNKDDEQVVSPFSIEQIKDDDKMIRFYTGFPSFQLLMICFKFLGAAVSNLSYGDQLKLAKGKPQKLSALNEFFLMLCRLRLGLLEQDSAHRYQISQSSVSRISSTWINCYSTFKELPIWPSRNVVDSNMPLAFKNLYPSTRCIIDATEIFIQKPQNPSAQQLTFPAIKTTILLKL